MTNQINIAFCELEFIYARSAGPGGQSVNTANSKVTLYWNVNESTSISTEIIERFKLKYSTFINDRGLVYITSQVHRSQKMNQDECIKKLYDMIELVRVPAKKRKPTKPKKSSVKKRLDSKKLHSVKKQNRNYKE